MNKWGYFAFGLMLGYFGIEKVINALLLMLK